MRILYGVFLSVFCLVANAHAGDLSDAINVVRNQCASIADDLNHMKTLAGINTAVTGVGTVAGAGAFGVGIAKAQADKASDTLDELIATLEQGGAIPVTSLDMFYDTYAQALAETDTVSGAQFAQQLKTAKGNLDTKSKKLGNWRTGLMAANTATNIAGAVIAGNNRIDDSLQNKINACVRAVKKLSDVSMQAKIENSEPQSEILRAEKIIRECDAWSVVDVSSIDKRALGASVSSGVGAGLGLVGTITSATANSDKDNFKNTKTEKNLNIVSNVMAGGTTVATGAAVVFNATQIAAIKNASRVADKCQEALK